MRMSESPSLNTPIGVRVWLQSVLWETCFSEGPKCLCKGDVTIQGLAPSRDHEVLGQPPSTYIDLRPQLEVVPEMAVDCRLTIDQEKLRGHSLHCFFGSFEKPGGGESLLLTPVVHVLY